MFRMPPSGRRGALRGAVLLLCLVSFLAGGCHQVHEARANKLRKSALEHFGRQEFDKALDHSEIALRLGAADPELHQMRAAIFLQRGEPEQALAETKAGLALAADPQGGRPPAGDPLQAQLEFTRGNALQGLGRLAEARAAFEAAVTLEEDFVGAQNNLAWLLATAPEAAVRDGAAAMAYAEKACELTNWEAAGILDTLAAAHAEAGNFPAAVKWQREAIEKIGKRELFQNTDGFDERLALYREKKPYREDPKTQYETNLRNAAEQSPPAP